MDGGFAEYISVPARNVLKLPSNILFEEGAIIGCAVSTAFHSLIRGRVEIGDIVVIYGVGGLGIHAVQLASKVFGAGEVIAIDISDKKLRLAKEVGADEVINASIENSVEELRKLTNDEYVDVVIDFVGHKNTIKNGIKCIGKGGRMVLVGIGRESIEILSYKTIIGREMEIIGVNDHLKSELLQLIKLVASGR